MNYPTPGNYIDMLHFYIDMYKISAYKELHALRKKKTAHSARVIFNKNWFLPLPVKHLIVSEDTFDSNNRQKRRDASTWYRAGCYKHLKVTEQSPVTHSWEWLRSICEGSETLTYSKRLMSAFIYHVSLSKIKTIL